VLSGDASSPVSFKLENFVARDIVNDWGDYFSSIDVVFNDDPYRNDFYEVKAKIGAIVRKESNGIFSGGTRSNDIVLKNEGYTEGIYTDDMAFSDALFNGDTCSLNIHFAYNDNVDYVYIILRSVSENYYRYKKSLYRYEVNSFSNILNSSNPVGLYSNIENGYGIFAGYSETVDSMYTYSEQHE